MEETRRPDITGATTPAGCLELAIDDWLEEGRAIGIGGLGKGKSCLFELISDLKANRNLRTCLRPRHINKRVVGAVGAVKGQ